MLINYKVPAFEDREVPYCNSEAYTGSEASIFFQKITMSNPRPALFQILTNFNFAPRKLLVYWEPDVANVYGQNYFTTLLKSKKQTYEVIW